MQQNAELKFEDLQRFNHVNQFIPIPALIFMRVAGIGGALIRRGQTRVHIEGIKARIFGTGNVGVQIVSDHEAIFLFKMLFLQ